MQWKEASPRTAAVLSRLQRPFLLLASRRMANSSAQHSSPSSCGPSQDLASPPSLSSLHSSNTTAHHSSSGCPPLGLPFPYLFTACSTFQACTAVTLYEEDRISPFSRLLPSLHVHPESLGGPKWLSLPGVGTGSALSGTCRGVVASANCQGQVTVCPPRSSQVRETMWAPSGPYLSLHSHGAGCQELRKEAEQSAGRHAGFFPSPLWDLPRGQLLPLPLFRTRRHDCDQI